MAHLGVEVKPKKWYTLTGHRIKEIPSWQCDLMVNSVDCSKFAILYIDDEEKSLKYFRKIFGEETRIFTVLSADEGYRVLKENRDIGIIMADQRMPGENGSQFLQNSRALCPGAFRILISAYSDIDVLIEATNSEAVDKYIAKPWNTEKLKAILMQARKDLTHRYERDRLLRERKSLLQKKTNDERLMSYCILADGMSHYIKNAMFSIDVFLNEWLPAMLEEQDESSLQFSHFWKVEFPKVREHVKKVSTLLSDLNSASIRPTGEPVDFIDLREIAERAVNLGRLYLERKKIHVVNTIPRSLPPIKAYKDQIERLFELLLKEMSSNTSSGGRISLAAKRISGSAHHKIQLDVKDDGPALLQTTGVPISNPFLIRKQNRQGFGFELMACFFIVYNHGGNVIIKSDKEKGNTVIINLK